MKSGKRMPPRLSTKEDHWETTWKFIVLKSRTDKTAPKIPLREGGPKVASITQLRKGQQQHLQAAEETRGTTVRKISNQKRANSQSSLYLRDLFPKR